MTPRELGAASVAATTIRAVSGWSHNVSATVPPNTKELLWSRIGNDALWPFVMAELSEQLPVRPLFISGDLT